MASSLLTEGQQGEKKVSHGQATTQKDLLLPKIMHGQSRVTEWNWLREIPEYDYSINCIFIDFNHTEK
jgi:hypothetical protein